jgi:hypothetical protein
VPAYWLVRHDILNARRHLNFSTLGATPPPAQKAKLYEAVNMIRLGAMPVPSFLRLHPEAKVSPDELALLENYLSPWTPVTSPRVEPAKTVSARIPLDSVTPEFNGLAFDASFESWKPIGTTDRGDNHSFRFILGNAVAVNAAQSGNTSPWPDGTRFAKIAWQQESGSDGLVHPGKFIQVELMVKDAKRYKDTEGWGWGRWLGAGLKPYGKDASFVNECTGCHRPLRASDYVYTLPVATAAVRSNGALPYQPLGWRGITMYGDPKTHTMATLYCNGAAIQAGSVLALVTWLQRDDPHWFGARIAGELRSVEFVQVAGPGQRSAYRHFSGSELIEEHSQPEAASQRASFISQLAPASLP